MHSTSSDPHVGQDNSPDILRNVDSSSASSSTYYYKRDFTKDSDRILKSTSNENSDRGLQPLTLKAADSLEIGCGKSRSAATTIFEHQVLRVDSVSHTSADNSIFKKGQIFHKIFVLCNSGYRSWPAGFRITNCREVGRSKQGEVHVGEDLGLTLFSRAPRALGRFILPIILTSIYDSSFRPQFECAFTTVEADDECVYYPKPQIYVTRTLLAFWICPEKRLLTPLCITSQSGLKYLVSEVFVVHNLQRGAEIRDHGTESLPNIDIGGQNYTSTRTIVLQWSFPGPVTIEGQHEFFVVPGNPFSEVVFGEGFFNSVTHTHPRFSEWIHDNPSLELGKWIANRRSLTDIFACR